MKCRLTFNASGVSFKAQESISNLRSTQLNADFVQDFPNSISFVHPTEFSDYWDKDYEKAYLDFIVENISVLEKHGAEEFSIFTEMYIEIGEQCNFEVLSEGFYPYIWKYNIGMPVSVYTVESVTTG